MESGAIVTTPTLVYLHGVGRGDLKQEWKDQLSQGLARIGFPSLDDVTVLNPVYADDLWEDPEAQHNFAVPPVQKHMTLSGLELLEFERRTAAMETRLGRHNRGAGGAFPEAVVSRSVELPLLYRPGISSTISRSELKCIAVFWSSFQPRERLCCWGTVWGR